VEDAMVSLKTCRLLIRDHLPGDLSGLHSLLSDADVMRYLPEIRCTSLGESEANLRQAIDQAARADRTKYFLAILERHSGAYVGEIGFTIVSPGLGQLGYFIHRSFWGKGYTTEAAAAVIDLAFGVVLLHKLVTGCLAENCASESVMVKCGFRREALLRQHVRHEGVWKDRVQYGMLRSEWTGLERRLVGETPNA
jgi:ribosomal-protein-alanine N-acetyltransferase